MDGGFFPVSESCESRQNLLALFKKCSSMDVFPTVLLLGDFKLLIHYDCLVSMDHTEQDIQEQL